MNIKSKIFLSTVAIIYILAFFVPGSVLGQSYSQGESKLGLSIDKKVRSSTMDQFYDNIAASKYLFHEGSIIEFQIKIENTGNIALENVKVKDFLPHHLSLQFYPGSINNGNLDWTIDKLAPGEVKSYLIRALIKIEPTYALGQQINKSSATVNSLSDTDTSIYYIGKPVVPVTGDTSAVIKLVVVISTIAGGIYLRKYARGY